MKETKKLTAEQIEALANEIREFLLAQGMWQDVEIFFNGQMYTTHDPITNNHYYNDRENLITVENVEPNFEYATSETPLSMAFEGPVCHMLYYNWYPAERRVFEKILQRYGLYYEFGNHWNITCDYI